MLLIKNKTLRSIYCAVISSICLFSCSKNNSEPTPLTTQSYSNPGRPSSYTFATNNTTTLTTVTTPNTFTLTYTPYVSKIYKMDTYTNNSWNYWLINYNDSSGYFKTYSSNKWDYWNYKFNNAKGIIKTYVSNTWDYWELFGTNNNFKIKTYTSKDWDYWEIYDKTSGQKILSIQTNFSNDFDSWIVKKNGKEVMRFSTNFSNDYDNWRFYPKESLNEEEIVAIHFIAVFTSSIHIQNINK